MKKSTIARLVLFSYGLNVSSLFLNILVKSYIFASLNFFFVIFLSLYLEYNYFDKEEPKDAV